MKPVLIAMNNPQSPYNRDHVLYPYPEGCAGHRLWRMLDEAAHGPEYGFAITKRQYLERFDRHNLLYAREWSAADARRAADDLLPALRGRVAAILGTRTLKALCLVRPGGGNSWFTWARNRELNLDYVLLPHPSGRCREYNDPMNRSIAGKTLLYMYRCDGVAR